MADISLPSEVPSFFVDIGKFSFQHGSQGNRYGSAIRTQQINLFSPEYKVIVFDITKTGSLSNEDIFEKLKERYGNIPSER